MCVSSLIAQEKKYIPYTVQKGESIRKIARKFDLSGEVVDKVRTDLNGPTQEGVPFVVKLIFIPYCFAKSKI